MKRPVLSVTLLLSVALSMGMWPPAASASLSSGTQLLALEDPTGAPDINKGIDLDRLQEAAYEESLSAVTEKLSSLASDVRALLGSSPDLVDLGYMAGTGSLVVYWSGDQSAPILSSVAKLASEHGLGLVIALRKVSKAQLGSAEAQVASNLGRYKAMGINVSAFGGFAADFDGIKLTVNEQGAKAKNKAAFAIDKSAFAKDLQGSIDIPTSVTYSNIKNLAGRYDDFAPFNAGGAMVSPSTGTLCTNGFGIVHGATMYRFLSARHCNDGPYTTDTGTHTYGSISIAGTGLNGAAVFGGQGSSLVFDGSSAGNPSSARVLKQKDPSLSTVGTPVCQEGANSGQRCGTIRQVAVMYNDQMGSTIRTNWVTSGSTAKIAASGDSGGPVISLHTLGRAWAVGILQAAYDLTTAGCTGLHYQGNECADNFLFTNVDYALSGFAGYAIRYS